MQLNKIEEGQTLTHRDRLNKNEVVVSQVEVTGFSKGCGYPIVEFADGKRLMVDPATLEDENATDDREEFRALGYEAREYTVRPGAGNQSSGRINVPKDWEGERVMIIRLE
jgi:hypothetical protein